MRTLLIASLVLSFLAHPALAADPFAEHYDAALKHLDADEYTAALKDLEEAYAVRQLPKVLYDLARVQRKLGNARAAIECYQRFLAADDQGDPATLAAAERELATLRVQLDPPRLQLAEPAMRPQYHYEWRRDRGMIAGGISLLATAYMGAVITGSIILDQNDRNSSSMYEQTNQPNSAAAGTLLVPVLGPLISAFCYLHASWSIPWLLVDAAAQVGGLSMIIVGARSKHKVAVLDKLVVSPYAVPEGGGLKISGRF